MKVPLQESVNDLIKHADRLLFSNEEKGNMKLLGRSNDLRKVATKKGTKMKEHDEMIQHFFFLETPSFDDDNDPDNRQL